MIRKALVAVAIFALATAGFGIGFLRAQQSSDRPAPQAAPVNNPNESDVPAYHANPPTGPLPATLDPKLFPGTLNQNIYALAAKEKPVLYQQPCYCHCDREVGHTSLLDCYVDKHASVCAVCKMEAVYAYEQTKLGKTPAQIREAIIQGKWKEVDLSKYKSPAAAK
ncbi:MAG: CYCXC family (seleno)protein [Candidatus Acidiferrales bacterium]